MRKKEKCRQRGDGSCSVCRYVVSLWQRVMWGDIIFLSDQLEFHKIQLEKAGRLLGTWSLGRNSYFRTAREGWDTWSPWREEKKNGGREYWSRRAKHSLTYSRKWSQPLISALEGEALHFVFCVTGYRCYSMDSGMEGARFSALWTPRCCRRSCWLPGFWGMEERCCL